MSRIWASAFHFSENTDVPDFPFFLARFVFRGKRRLVFCWCVSSLARPNWRGPPLTPLGLPLGDWRHCRSGRVWEERTSGRHPGVGNTERWDRARRSSKQREKESKPKACQPPGCQPRLRSSQKRGAGKADMAKAEKEVLKKVSFPKKCCGFFLIFWGPPGAGNGSKMCPRGPAFEPQSIVQIRPMAARLVAKSRFHFF